MPGWSVDRGCFLVRRVHNGIGVPSPLASAGVTQARRTGSEDGDRSSLLARPSTCLSPGFIYGTGFVRPSMSMAPSTIGSA